MEPYQRDHSPRTRTPLRSQYDYDCREDTSHQHDPGVARGLQGRARTEQAAAIDIDPDLAELIKIRASQMNHCAFCIDMHTADARKRGINEQKLALLPAWEEAEGIFTEQEQAALALTEEMTDLTHRHVSDEVYARAAEAFTERESARSSRWR